MVLLFCYFLPMLLGNQSLVTCLFAMREEPVFLSFFRLVLSPCSPDSVSLGQSVLFGLLLSQGRTFLFFLFHLALSLLGSLFILDSFLSYKELIFRMNLSKIKFTCLDYSYLFLYRFNSTLTMKSRDEKAIFFWLKNWFSCCDDQPIRIELTFSEYTFC